MYYLFKVLYRSTSADFVSLRCCLYFWNWYAGYWMLDVVVISRILNITVCCSVYIAIAYSKIRNIFLLWGCGYNLDTVKLREAPSFLRTLSSHCNKNESRGLVPPFEPFIFTILIIHFDRRYEFELDFVYYWCLISHLPWHLYYLIMLLYLSYICIPIKISLEHNNKINVWTTIILMY